MRSPDDIASGGRLVPVRRHWYRKTVAARSGPGPLAPVHRITIITAFLGSLAYLAWELNQAVSTAAPAAIARAMAAAGVAVALGLYLRNLRARLDAKLRPPSPDRHPGP